MGRRGAHALHTRKRPRVDGPGILSSSTFQHPGPGTLEAAAQMFSTPSQRSPGEKAEKVL